MNQGNIQTIEKQESKLSKINFLKIATKLVLFFAYTFIFSTIATYILIYHLEITDGSYPSATNYLVGIVRQYPVIPISIIIIGIVLTVFSTKKLKAYKYKSNGCGTLLIEAGSSLFLFIVSNLFIMISPILIAGIFANYQSDEIQKEVNTNVKINADSSVDEIVEYLQMSDCPTIYLERDKASDDLYFEEIDKYKGGDLFKELYLNHMLDNSSAFVDYKESIFLYDDNLYILDVDEDILKQIDNELAHSIFKCDFPEYEVNPEIEISYYSEDEFREIRKEASKAILAEIDTIIAAYEEFMTLIIEEKDEMYYYYETDPSPAWKETWLGLYNDYVVLYEEMEIQYEEMKEYRENLAKNLEDTSSILGHYDSGNEIAVVIDDTYNDFPRQYMTTLIHEYNHYASDSDNDLPLSLNEAFTQMYTERAFSKISSSKPVHSYVVETRLLRSLLDDTSNKDLEKAYFSQDETVLKTEFDTLYGEDAYEDISDSFNEFYFLDYYDQVDLADEIKDKYEI